MYCIIDIGSNTIRLVVYRVEGGTIKPMLNNKFSAGLAGYIDRDHIMRRDGIEKAVEVLSEFRTVLDMLPDCEVFPFATASLRNISNTAEVVAEIRERTGFDIRVLSGKEEALFDYHGAMRSMKNGSGLLVDIGGGSTETVFFRDGKVQLAESMPMGSLNLYSRFVDGLLPTPKELGRIEREVRRQLRRAVPPDSSYVAQPLCGVGGTARAALALYRGIFHLGDEVREYDCSFFYRVIYLLEHDPKRVTSRILKIAPERIHTIIPGIMILRIISETYGSRTVVTSPYGVREGYLYNILEQRGELNA